MWHDRQKRQGRALYSPVKSDGYCITWSIDAYFALLYEDTCGILLHVSSYLEAVVQLTKINVECKSKSLCFLITLLHFKVWKYIKNLIAVKSSILKILDEFQHLVRQCALLVSFWEQSITTIIFLERSCVSQGGLSFETRAILRVNYRNKRMARDSLMRISCSWISTYCNKNAVVCTCVWRTHARKWSSCQECGRQQILESSINVSLQLTSGLPKTAGCQFFLWILIKYRTQTRVRNKLWKLLMKQISWGIFKWIFIRKNLSTYLIVNFKNIQFIRN